MAHEPLGRIVCNEALDIIFEVFRVSRSVAIRTGFEKDAAGPDSVGRFVILTTPIDVQARTEYIEDVFRLERRFDVNLGENRRGRHNRKAAFYKPWKL